MFAAVFLVRAAQADVQVYGRVNLSMEQREQPRGFTLADNASRIGFIETEKIGPGLEAGLHLEMGFDATTGQPYGKGFDRGSELFFGTPNVRLSIGSVGSTAYLAITDVVSLHNHDTGVSADALFAHVEPLAHKIGVTVNAGGWTLQAMNWRADPLVTGSAGTAFMVAYARSGLSVALSSGRDDHRHEHSGRFLWQSGALVLGGYVEEDRNVYGHGTRVLRRLAMGWHVGASEFHINAAVATGYSGGVPGEAGAKQGTLGYNYNLSARTKVYALATRVHDDGHLYGSRRATAIGLRHNF